MAELSRDEFVRLQRDAEERLRQMQRKSEQLTGVPPAPEFVKIRETEKTPTKIKNRPERKGGFDLLKMFNFSNLQLDSDRVLIIAVLLLLMSESSDELLMLALIYIML